MEGSHRFGTEGQAQKQAVVQPLILGEEALLRSIVQRFGDLF